MRDRWFFGSAIVLGLFLGGLNIWAQSVTYDRDDWRHWIDADGDCQDTRTEVLERQARRVGATNRNGCAILSGEWVDPFSGEQVTEARRLDVDHLVPLAEAHASGAAVWTNEERERYANDLAPGHLVAVGARWNRQKGARDPAGWMPPLAAVHCEYLRDWIDVKGRYRLSMDGDEVAAIALELARHNC